MNKRYNSIIARHSDPERLITNISESTILGKLCRRNPRQYVYYPEYIYNTEKVHWKIWLDEFKLWYARKVLGYAIDEDHIRNFSQKQVLSKILNCMRKNTVRKELLSIPFFTEGLIESLHDSVQKIGVYDRKVFNVNLAKDIINIKTAFTRKVEIGKFEPYPNNTSIRYTFMFHGFYKAKLLADSVRKYDVYAGRGECPDQYSVVPKGVGSEPVR
ncbi:hypothetical protein QR680_000118 [Steinernema hermaphroditum]|uniref:Uncharacterized protein n=1 Tax=Steinernema hermaphroditum TaxID=289476 RepID=A0AA39GV05_9BILA|nr:hypothetical protein QR680_000118 [Steinernema hermaphroditum]